MSKGKSLVMEKEGRPSVLRRGVCFSAIGEAVTESRASTRVLIAEVSRSSLFVEYATRGFSFSQCCESSCREVSCG